MRDMPGYLEPVRGRTEWLDLIYRSDLTPEHKLTATVLSKTMIYNKKEQLFMTNISPYTVSRVLNVSILEAKVWIDDLLDYGWLWDTGTSVGARTFYILCINLNPKELRK